MDSCAFRSVYTGTKYEDNIRGAEVWYKIQGSGGRVGISTCSQETEFDTVIAVYQDSNCLYDNCMISLDQLRSGKVVREDQPLAANDDDETCTETSKGASSVVFDTVEGEEYKLYVGDRYGRLDGAFGLTATAFVPPPNDKCQDAAALPTDGVEVVGSTVNATITSTMDSCAFRSVYAGRIYEDNIRGAEVWYKVVGTGSRINLSTCSSLTNFDTVIGVYTDATCFSDECLLDLDGNEVANDNDEECMETQHGASTVSFDSVVGVTYKFYVGDRLGRLDGIFGLKVTSS
jgi:hypothetical protein